MGYVVYYRVLKEELESKEQSMKYQRTIVNEYFNTISGYSRLVTKGKDGLSIVAEFTDIEDNKETDRNGFKEALLLCKNYGYTLVVSEVKRVSFLVTVVAKVMEDLNLKVAIRPNSSNFELHMESIHLQKEAEFRQSLGQDIRVCDKGVDYLDVAKKEDTIRKYTKLYNEGKLEKHLFDFVISGLN